ncbi:MULTISPECIES: hypothetical protein [Brevibacillus]|uniref:Uncharacterized protein n=1 Tax=Brevibacillus parabrevis TaxID=54914 RepID=A0A4Y3PHX7_BREPA|nr:MULTISPECIES: hypothetical protein [Brevibacillus]KZE47093.1 hypothetical protein AV540_20020 [Brevibacillus parabrevis]MBU8714163.1 hypothetical protein [Brevibacillus parabrevis]MDR5001802.1 hypothetical protein [Brevibacillus parabrevis]MED2253456.1 hypothetical protein [Brevibacillus parabrevis]NRQ55749.1 hypothetical protein [Brevibacillus sp. HD1.4A]
MNRKLVASFITSCVVLATITTAFAATPMGIAQSEASISGNLSTAGGEKHYVISSYGITRDISSRVKSSDIKQIISFAIITRNGKKVSSKTTEDSYVKSLKAKISNQEEYGKAIWEVAASGDVYYTDGTTDSGINYEEQEFNVK